jgi:hypothetical protein
MHCENIYELLLFMLYTYKFQSFMHSMEHVKFTIQHLKICVYFEH